MPAPAPLGRALAETARKILAPPGPPSKSGDLAAKFQGDLYVDLNGEEWKANAWGHAIPRLARHIDFERSRVFVPAESLGETGAASAPVAMAWALYQMTEDGTESALVLSLSDRGEAAAIRLSSVPTP
jgi:3-oxoacyl-[acyl-carrier-protein] synthase-1